ncbi:MAG: hypothetical protein V4673_16185 [Pseudomonadota bacterium]
MRRVSRLARIAALSLVLGSALPAFAVAASPAPLTIAQSREAQALFGFDVAIPKIIEEAFKEQPQYRTMTPTQRECLLGMASPAFHGLFDDAFIELFGDTDVLASWKAFSLTPAGKVFIDGLRRAVLFKIDGDPEPDMSGILDALGDAEKADIVAFMESPAAGVMKKGFPDVEFPPGMEKTLQARAEQECGVTLDKL